MLIGKSKIKRAIYSVKTNSKTLLRKDYIDTKGERDIIDIAISILGRAPMVLNI